LLSDKDAQDRFLKQDYFQRAWCWHVRTPRDLFRELFKYLTDEGNKTASKYGKVLWHLYQDQVHPEEAVSAISLSGGIEKVARSGLQKPTYYDPRDVGDGMDPYGRKIHYPDDPPEGDEGQGKHKREPKTDNAQMVLDAVDMAPADEGVVNIQAKYIKTPTGPYLTFLGVETSDVAIVISERKKGKLKNLPPGRRLKLEFLRHEKVVVATKAIAVMTSPVAARKLRAQT
jgi:hypothetical protein